ncbi:MAG: HEAT repeat domain-containing protein [Pseudomonadales bacterium]
MKQSPPLLLSDEQVREFICNGFIRLEADLPAALHKRIDAHVRHAMESEFQMGNNVLPRIPEMYEVLESPEVRGALTSILGPRYALHPHRFVHSSTPLDDPDIELDVSVNAPRMGKGSMAGSGWHQDAQSPLARARHHLPRYALIFYFPHDTPLEMGPTRLQGGSHLYSHPTNPKGVVLPEGIRAGSMILMHFDIVHAAFPNRMDVIRYLVKFVFARTQAPTAPTWDAKDGAWHRPANCIPEDDLTVPWTIIWNWLRGEPSIGGPIREPEHEDIAAVLDAMGSNDETRRLNAIYALAGIGSEAIPALVAHLEAFAGRRLHERTLAKDAQGRTIPRDASVPERRWNERAIVMEDSAYALGAMGEAAVPALLSLLDHDDPWIKINACFSLGEVGPGAANAVPRIAAILDHPCQQVVRQALDALGAIGCALGPALPRIERLITTTNPEWQEGLVIRGWTAQNQVRLNAVYALLNAIDAQTSEREAMESILIASLDDPNGYVADVACEALIRMGDEDGNIAVMRHLQRRRWDDTLMGGARIY